MTHGPKTFPDGEVILANECKTISVHVKFRFMQNNECIKLNTFIWTMRFSTSVLIFNFETLLLFQGRNYKKRLNLNVE